MMFGISLNDTNENVKKLQVELMNKGMLVDVTKGILFDYFRRILLRKRKLTHL